MRTQIRNAIVVTVAALALAGAVACSGGATPTDPANHTTGATRTPTAEPTKTPTKKPTAATRAAGALTKSDIQLTVKTTKKDCFGSAGCNVDYKISAALEEGVAYQECDVTYDVHGLEDTQTGTLELHTDGTYNQDGYQSGSTSSSSKKLTAKVTDIDCSVVR